MINIIKGCWDKLYNNKFMRGIIYIFLGITSIFTLYIFITSYGFIFSYFNFFFYNAEVNKVCNVNTPLNFLGICFFYGLIALLQSAIIGFIIGSICFIFWIIGYGIYNGINDCCSFKYREYETMV
jgi:hypothetical protein